MPQKTGLIQKAIAGFYYCFSDGEVYECKARGIFRNENITPLVGDQVRFEVEDAGRGFITEVLPRRNEFTRPPMANLDRLFIIASVADPVPSTQVIDKLITVCEYKGIEPIIVITKTDLGDPSRLSSIYRSAGYSVLMVTNQDDDYSIVRKALRGGVSAFAGNTGVGKSSLLNNICPELQLETGQTSKKLGRGRHTTRHVELYYLPGQDGWVADTPGFGSMEMARYVLIHKEDLAGCFREFEPYLGNCRFQDCSHTTEQGCAVLEAVRAGEIAASRFESYTVLYEEAKQVKEWERKDYRKVSDEK